MYMQGSVPSLLTGNYSMALLANRPHANENKKLKMRNKKIMIEKLKVPSLSNTFHKSDLRMERRQG